MLRYLATSIAIFTLLSSTAQANQQYKPLSASVSTVLQHSVADAASPRLAFQDEMDGAVWLADMSSRMRQYIRDDTARHDFLVTAHYEATRAGLDPQMVLALIEVESAFRKYAISKSGARGYMQVMPFWLNQIGRPDDNLLHINTNLRYGCTILKFYLEKENGDLQRALSRYNGSQGKRKYPDKVIDKLTTKWFQG